jgi:hypothetical protein
LLTNLIEGKNMTKIKNTLITLLAALAMSSSAFAFEGLSIGVVTSTADVETRGFETKGQAGGSMEKSATITKSNTVDFGSIFAEYTFSQGSTFGLEYIPDEANMGTSTRVHTLNGTGQNVAGTITAKAQLSDHFTVYMEPTMMMTDTFGIYLKGGASRVTVESLDSQTATTIAGTYGNQDVWGVSYGIGAKVYRGGLFLKLDHLTTEYDQVSLNSSTNKNITAEIDSEATRLSIGYNF